MIRNDLHLHRATLALIAGLFFATGPVNATVLDFNFDGSLVGCAPSPGICGAFTGMLSAADDQTGTEDEGAYTYAADIMVTLADGATVSTSSFLATPGVTTPGGSASPDQVTVEFVGILNLNWQFSTGDLVVDDITDVLAALQDATRVQSAFASRQGCNDAGCRGDLSLLTLKAVPEPATALLVACALLGLASRGGQRPRTRAGAVNPA